MTHFLLVLASDKSTSNSCKLSRMIPSLCALIALLGASSAFKVAPGAASHANCLQVAQSSESFTGTCSAPWGPLKHIMMPTQKEVGYAWVKYKVDKEFPTADAAQQTMDAVPTPAVLGPSGRLYIVDDHHTLCALDYSEYWDVVVPVNVICDLRSLSVDQFWSHMASQNLAYLAAHPQGQPDALPVPIKPSQLPQYFSFNGTESSFVFADDPWRSVAGYSRKVEKASAPAPKCIEGDDKYCERCMLRGCGDGSAQTGPGVDYFEFRWGYFFNDATLFTPSLWPSSSTHTTFKDAYEQLPKGAVVDADTSAWMALADSVVSLCRTEATGGYVVPSFFPGESKLPGYVQGYVRLDADPACDPPQCRAQF